MCGALGAACTAEKRPSTRPSLVRSTMRAPGAKCRLSSASISMQIHILVLAVNRVRSAVNIDPCAFAASSPRGCLPLSPRRLQYLFAFLLAQFVRGLRAATRQSECLHWELIRAKCVIALPFVPGSVPVDAGVRARAGAGAKPATPGAKPSAAIGWGAIIERLIV